MTSRSVINATGFWLCLVGVVLAFLWHISVGAKAIPILTVWDAIIAPRDDVFDHVIVQRFRLPRALYSCTVGASLAVAGALMQGVTRNSLAEPAILGLIAGATFAVVIGIGWFGIAGTAFIPIAAALGALGGITLVWVLASAVPGGARPLTLILAGVAVSAFLAAIESAAILINENLFNSFRLWLSGSLAFGSMDVFTWALSFCLIGLGLSFLIARQVTALSMGEDAAIGLGVNPTRIRIIALIAVVALSAFSVAIAGPLGFIGLVVPHAVRLLVGSDYRWIIPFSAVAGAGYLLVIDTLARIVLAPTEISTGIITVLVGAPVFIWLVRSKL